jgi:hypothetical protein
MEFKSEEQKTKEEGNFCPVMPEAFRGGGGRLTGSEPLSKLVKVRITEVLLNVFRKVIKWI